MNIDSDASLGTYVLKRVIIVLFLAAGFFFFLYSAVAFQMNQQRSILNQFVRKAATETVKHCTSQKIWMDITPVESNPMIAQIFSEVFLNSGKQVVRAALQDNQKMIIDVRELKHGISPLSDTKYLRVSSMNVGVTLENNADKSITWSHEFLESFSDTVQQSHEIESYSQDGTQTHSFFETLLEPILITATAIVIVILLFTVRGS